MRLSTLLLAALLPALPVQAGPPATTPPMDAEWVQAHPDALPALQAQHPVRAAAFQAFVQTPEVATRIAEARPMPSRARRMRLPPGIGAPQAAAVHLDQALHGPTELRAAHARLGAALIEQPDLLDSFLEHAAAPERAAALAGLRGRAGAPWTELLVSSMRDADPTVREAAVSVLGRRPQAAAHLDVLVRASADPSASVRMLSVRALGVYGGAEQIDTVLAGISDIEAPVRLAALHALERLSVSRAQDVAASLIDDRDPGVRRAARQVISPEPPAR